MRHLLQIFEETAERFPDKKAVGDQEDSYTFSELRQMARRMAAVILDKAGRGRPVCVLVNRGKDTMALFLGVLYSGNFYVPLDPDMPLAKIRDEFETSEACLLLGGDENRELIESLSPDVPFLTLKDMGQQEAPMPDIHPEDPIYMVFTSGSTGKPKGILKSYGAVLDFIASYAEHFDLTDREVIGNQTPFFFDASAKDLYLMMYTGATLEVLPSEMFILPLRLIDYMNQRGITYICWVPTALALVIQMKVFRKVLPTSLKKVFFVGEVFPMKQLGEWLKTLPDLQYVNLYGSTEIAGICCYYELDSSCTYDYLPIGKTLPNCEVYLYDNGAFVSEPGQIGEVLVVSQALALGYYKDAERTQNTFTEHVINGEKKRVLKTGDFARYDEDGNLIFVTRKDFQIKHMGRRVELGEIEAVCDSLPCIMRCACLYNDQKKRIHLFCQLMPGYDWGKKEIIHELRGRLSEYMLPTRVTVLDKMPYNANGKINRTLLKEML
ncbi:MAG: amino acid adenylation domain-containing protein [Lachnospiraceae bacterium]|nr:amino acid adenylation domain-containing protein [Lachnospiraceae bacterium]